VRTGQVNARAGDNATEEASRAGYSKESQAELHRLVALGIITSPSQVGGYPDYKGEPYKDSDGDGLPDDWEQKHGLNPKDSSDASGDSNGDGYTNIEDFINDLDPRSAKADWSDLKNNVDRRNN
jgi:hypothetical protein